MELGLRDRVCLVTGSTSGIGLETARLLAAEGARVVVSGRYGDRVEQARQEAGAAVGLVADLSEPDAAVELVERRLVCVTDVVHEAVHGAERTRRLIDEFGSRGGLR